MSTYITQLSQFADEEAQNKLALQKQEEQLDTDEDGEVKTMINSTGIDHTAEFEVLVDTVSTSLSEVQASVQELILLKDEILLHHLPPSFLFKIAVICGRVYRNFSDMNTPVYELLRLVKIYSASWEKNSVIFKKLNDMYENKKQMLNIAIKRLAMNEKKNKLFAKERRILNWEKMFIKMSEARGHGRRWKFQIETFRNKANMGYDELVKWIEKEAQTTSNQEVEQQQNSRAKRREKKSRNRRANQNDSMNNDYNDVVEIDSDQDIFSDMDSLLDENKLHQNEQEAKSNEEPQVPAKEFAEINTQTEPDVEDKITWTGEPDYKRCLIVRLFRPIEFEKRKLKFKLKLGNSTLNSKAFDPLISEKDLKPSPTDPKQKPKPKMKAAKDKKEIDGEKKEEERKVDITKFQDFLFEINESFKPKEILNTKANNDECIAIEMKADDKEKEDLTGFSNIPIDDVHTLDLPILYYKENQEAEVVDFNSQQALPTTKDKKKADAQKQTAANWLTLEDFKEESLEKYAYLSNRTPLSFSVFKTKTAKSTDPALCKLPLMFFWTKRPIELTRNKNTATQSINQIIEEITKGTEDEQNESKLEKKSVEMVDKGCSPIPLLSSIRSNSVRFSIDSENVKLPHPVKTEEETNQIEIKVDTGESIEEYQMKIDQLNLHIYKLENELAHYKELYEMKEKTRTERYNRNRASIMSKQSESMQNMIERAKQKDKASAVQVPRKSYQSNRNLPEDFFIRLKMFNEKSVEHHKEILNKYLSEEAAIREQQMAVQHRLDTELQRNPNLDSSQLDDLCLPAVFMPYKSPNNIYNPRAHQYFHPSGSNDPRLTQPPTVFQLPPLPSKTAVSVINLFDLGRIYEAGEPDNYINQYINNAAERLKQNQKEASENKSVNERFEPSLEEKLINEDILVIHSELTTNNKAES